MRSFKKLLLCTLAALLLIAALPISLSAAPRSGRGGGRMGGGMRLGGLRQGTYCAAYCPAYGSSGTCAYYPYCLR